MGNVFGSNNSMAENFRKNQEFITEMNKIKMERHIQMHNQMRERREATKIAHDRELVLWATALYVTFIPFLFLGWKRTGSYNYLSPVIPMTFLLAYKADEGYGNKVERVRQEAEMIMQFTPELLDLPCGLPTPSAIDQARLGEEEKKRLHPTIPAL